MRTGTSTTALIASSARSSSTTAPTASSSTARPARPRRFPRRSAPDLIRAALEAVGDRAAVVAGTGTNSTAHSIELTEQAQEAGAHAVLVVTPYYNKPPQRGIVAHFDAVAAATDLPVVAYNIPGRCVINIEPETMTELAQIANVKAVKQSNADLDQARHIVELGLDLYAGDDNLVLPFVELGGLGGVCVHTHVVGPQVKELVQRFRAGTSRRHGSWTTSLRPPTS